MTGVNLTYIFLTPGGQTGVDSNHGPPLGKVCACNPGAHGEWDLI